MQKKDIFNLVLQTTIRKSFIAEIRPEWTAEKVIHSEKKKFAKGTEVLNSTAHPGNCLSFYPVGYEVSRLSVA